MCRIGAIAAIVLAAGCAAPDERHAEQMMLGQQYYNNGKFYESIGRFASASEFANNTREQYQAMLGVANASAEYGLIMYEYAERLLRDNKRTAGIKKWQDADKWHDDAARAFYKCLEMRPYDTIANKGLGDLFYRRSTSFSVLPYLENEAGFALRQKERDEAVRQYEIVLAGESGDITSPEHGPNCKSPHIHRYLALALFTRSDWDKNDSEEARRHMMVYLNYLNWAQQTLIDRQVGQDDQQKLEKEKRMDEFRKQIGETRSLLTDQLKGLKDLIVFWQKDAVIRARLKQAEEDLKRAPASDKKDHQAEVDKVKAEVKRLPPPGKNEAWTLAARREITALDQLRQEFENAAVEARKKAKAAASTNN